MPWHRCLESFRGNEFFRLPAHTNLRQTMNSDQNIKPKKCRYFISSGGEICISFRACVVDAVCYHLLKIEKIFCWAMGNRKGFDIYFTESGRLVNSVDHFFFLRTSVAVVFFALFLIEEDINIRSVVNFFHL